MISSTPETVASPDLERPDRASLETIFRLKYGDPDATGWGPRMRWKFGYFNPDEQYEATVDKLVTEDTRWIDVGCGRDLFPSNRPLAKILAERAKLLVGVDPDATLEENPFVHQKVRVVIDDFETEEPFDLVTLRMVAEHVEHPDKVAEVFQRITAPGGFAVIFTVYRWSPVPIITDFVPFKLHHPVKHFFWRTEAKDTFPTCFKMNTRGQLRELFDRHGFDEARFDMLDDCRSLSRFKAGLWSELTARKVFNGMGMGYPERCILGIYRRRAD